MATLYITEFSDLGHDTGLAPVAQLPENTTQTVAIGGASAQSAAVANNTKYIRLHTDAICSVLVGTNPTATATKGRMAAGQTEYFKLDKVGAGYKVAVITNT